MPTKQKHKGYMNGGGGGYFPPTAAPPPNVYRSSQAPFGYYYNSSSPNSRMTAPGVSSPEGRRYDDQTTPSYAVEHLATFGYGSQFNLYSSDDGIKKLKQMELSQAIWAQKMILRLRHDAIVVEDENAEVVEIFPMNLVAEPSAHLSTDPRDVYNNLLVFVVNEDQQKRSATPTEMHIFQCARISANDVVDDIKKFLQGRGSTVPPGRRETGFLLTAANNEPPQPSAKPNGYHPREDDAQSVSVTFERDVNMLNRCFDDIERFVARIQHAAMIQRESEKKRPGVRQQIPPQFPSESEFFDILQKFKLCFNLLAKLKNHIHEPNAPELLHFLFTPFTVILDACNWGIGHNVAHRVYNPPITPEAKVLLQNSLTSRETEVWMSLGDAWTVPGPQQNGGGSLFTYPAEPPRPVGGVIMNNGDAEHQMDMFSKRIRRLALEEAQLQREREDLAKKEWELKQKEQILKEKEEEIERSSRTTPDDTILMPSPPMHRPSSDHHDYRPNYPGSTTHSSPGVIDGEFVSSDSPRQRAFLEDLKSRRAKSAQVTYDRVGQNPKELTVSKGEFLEILNDTKKWWECRNIHNRIGYVPHTILSLVYDGGDPSSRSKTQPAPSTTIANGRTHLSPARPREYDDNERQEDYDDGNFNPGPSKNQRYRQDIYLVNEAVAQHIRARSPKPTYPVRAPSPRLTHSTSVQTQNVTNSEVQTEDRPAATVSSLAPPAPVPPPAPVLPPQEAMKKVQVTLAEKPFEQVHPQPSGRQTVPDETLNELKRTIKGNEWIRNSHVNISDALINEYSNAMAVKDWLQKKGFSLRTIDVLDGQSGGTLFALSKHQLQQFCGQEEGKLLYSQLLVQKSLSGYNTKTDAELKAILEVRKGKAETNANANDVSSQEKQQPIPLTTLFVNTNGETVANGAQY